MGAPVDQVYENVVFTGKHLYNEVYNMSGTMNLCQVFSGSPIFKKKMREKIDHGLSSIIIEEVPPVVGVMA